jgi:murein DD-endopeptidase
VYYSYRRAGIAVPRSTTAQYRHARPVTFKHLQPGDLLFFKRAFHSISHVGIYAGNGRFIHAPSKGRVVSYDSLKDPYWKKRLVAAGRYE